MLEIEDAEDSPEVAQYLVGIDIGGTFTDCVVIDNQGVITSAKAPSTPGDFAAGVIDALAATSKTLDLTIEDLCRSTYLLAHGTTVGTNAILQKTGARVGLITTKGHNDVIHIMRGSRGLTSQDLRKVVHFPESAKPEPIVPKKLIFGISERIDCKGAVVTPLNEAEANKAIDRLIESGVQAVAVCLLWSFKRPEHEQRVKEMIAERAPDIFVTCSSDIAPKWGEYERTTAAVLNSYIGPSTVGYLGDLKGRLEALGLSNPIQIAQCGGGTISIGSAIKSPLLTLHSGPVAGVLGSKFLGDIMETPNVITTDMGGTSFDVGMIHDGTPSSSYLSVVNQYEYFLPRISIEAIGSGGGSLVNVDPATRTIKVGPESAGADPGPVCYGRGGTIPTVTDAALVLGYIGTHGFAGGKIALNKSAAESAIGRIAEQLDMTLLECAAGIIRIVEFQMADLIRKMTVQKGFDPRDFILYAFGGAGPLYASVFAFEAGVQRIVVPQRRMASSWCAFGTASADVLHIFEVADILTSPLPLGRINEHLSTLKHRGRLRLLDDGIDEEHHNLIFSIDLRHRGQVNEVEVQLNTDQLDAECMEKLCSDFYESYERLYGQGSSFQGAQIESVTYRLRAMANMRKPALPRTQVLSKQVPADACRGTRSIYWAECKTSVDTPIFDGQLMHSGNEVAGPAVLETPDTSVVINPGCTGRVDQFGNIEINRIVE